MCCPHHLWSRWKRIHRAPPLNEDGENEDGDVFIYRYKEVDGEPTLENIEDDDEYEVAADAFDEWLDEQDFDALDDEE